MVVFSWLCFVTEEIQWFASLCLASTELSPNESDTNVFLSTDDILSSKETDTSTNDAYCSSSSSAISSPIQLGGQSQSSIIAPHAVFRLRLSESINGISSEFSIDLETGRFSFFYPGRYSYEIFLSTKIGFF